LKIFLKLKIKIKQKNIKQKNEIGLSEITSSPK